MNKNKLMAIVLLSLLAVGVSAGIVNYYGKIELNVNVNQAVLLDGMVCIDKEGTGCTNTTTIESATGGDIFCFEHELENNAVINASVEFITIGEGGVETKIYINDLNKWCEGVDFNQDGKVDLTDLAIFGVIKGTLDDEFGKTGCSETNDWCNGADYNQDGKVDTTDLTILAVMKGTLDDEYGKTDCEDNTALIDENTLNIESNSTIPLLVCYEFAIDIIAGEYYMTTKVQPQ